MEHEKRRIPLKRSFEKNKPYSLTAKKNKQDTDDKHSIRVEVNQMKKESF